VNKEQLKEKILHAVQKGDIAQLYMLEQVAHEHLDEESLHGFYANILDLALEKLTNTLESHTTMDTTQVQDFATLRALYEYAIEHYSAGDKNDAAALFEVLSGLSNDKNFSQAMHYHTHAAQKQISLEDFIENYADVDATQQSGSFYLNCFKEKAQELLEDSQSKGE
jgi:hypothetical protein